MDQLQPKTKNTLAMFVLYILLILFIPDILAKLYHRAGEYQLPPQNIRRTGECCLG